MRSNNTPPCVRQISAQEQHTTHNTSSHPMTSEPRDKHLSTSAPTPINPRNSTQTMKPLSAADNQNQQTPKSTAKSMQQKLSPKYPEDANIWYGETITTPKQPHTLRIYYQNIRGAKQYEDKWDPWKRGHQKMHDFEIDISTLVETNTRWTYTNIRQANTTITKIHKQLRSAMAGSNDSTESDYQPGGTYCSIHGKWTGQILERITDPSGLGRWTGFKLEGKHRQHLIIISVYRPTPSNDKSDNTCYSQQWRILRQSASTTNPEPREKLITDLITQCKQWRQEHAEILLGIDANESIESTKPALLRLMQETSMTSLHRKTHSPITYARGKHCIDFMMGTPKIAEAVKAAGYFPFFAGAWHSDHRALYIDIDTLALFNGDPHNLESATNRNLLSNNKLQSSKFLNSLTRNKTLPKLANRIFNLNNIATWTHDHHSQLETIDKTFTTILLKAEGRCKPKSSAPWSPELHEAFLIQSYWKKTISSQLTRKSVHTQLTEITNQLLDPTKVWQGKHDRSARSQLNLANKHLKNTKRKATELRNDHLIRRSQAHSANNDNEKAQILLKIRNAEQ
jgi:hypothetical protein